MNTNKTTNKLEVTNMIGFVNGVERVRLLVGLAITQNKFTDCQLLFISLRRQSLFGNTDRLIKQCSLHITNIFSGKIRKACFVPFNY